MIVKIVFITNGTDAYFTTGDVYIQRDDKIYALVRLPDGKLHRVNLYSFDRLDDDVENLVSKLNEKYMNEVLEIPADSLPVLRTYVGHYKKGAPGNATTTCKWDYRKFNNYIRKQITGSKRIVKLQ